MIIRFLLPSSPSMRNGNSVTSDRWRAFFEAMGHQVRSASSGGERCDLLVAFHAYKTRDAIMEVKTAGLAARLVICLTGTDLYQDLKQEPAARDVLYLADRLVVLQPRALDELPPDLRERTSVVYQSAVAPPSPGPRELQTFDVCVIAHLREVKDPLRAAKAARLLPAASRIRVIHVGAALSGRFAGEAAREVAENPRYLWLGEQTAQRTAKVLARSRFLVLSSFLEGGANVVSEAVVAGVPVLASDIPCTWGLLGDDYPGLFPPGDTAKLAELLVRAESDPAYRRELAERCRKVAWKFEPALERESLRALLNSLFPAL